MGIFTNKNKNIVDPKKPIFAWTLGGVLQKQLVDIKQNIPKGYTLIMNHDNKLLPIIQSYVSNKNSEFIDKHIFLVNEYMRFFSKTERVLCMVVQDFNTRTSVGVTANSQGAQPTVTMDVPLDNYDSIFVFLEKGDKIFVFCIYDRDKTDLNKIVDNFKK